MIPLLLEARRSVRRLAWSAIAVMVLTSVASASLFSIADPLLLAPLPFPHADQVISIAPPFELSRRMKTEALALITEEVRQSPMLDSAARVRQGFTHELPGAAVDSSIVHYVVGPDFLQTLGVRPVLGRTLTPADATAVPRPVMMRESLWARYGHDASRIGRTVSLGTSDVRVVGVVADGSAFPATATLWSAAEPGELAATLPTIARMRPGITIDQVRSRFPALVIGTLEDIVRPRQRLTLWLVLASAAGMALIGWLQLSSLLLSRLTSRSRELAVRAACGASARRIRAELAVEGAVHVCVAMSVVLLALPMAAGLVSGLMGASFPDWKLEAPGIRSYLYAFLVTIGAATASHLTAWLILEKHYQRSLSLRHASEWSMTPSISRTRTVLLFAQVAVTASVLYATALASLNFARITSVPLGYKPEGVFGITPRAPQFASLQERLAHKVRLEEAAARIRLLPGVMSVAPAFRRPMQTGAMRGTARIPRRPDCAPRTVRTNYVGSEYFRTLSIAVLDGRVMHPIENAAVIDQRFARELADCGAVIGDLLQVTSHRLPIVGVVAVVAENLGGLPTEPQVYLPDVFGVAETLLIRTGGTTAAIASAREMLAADFRGPADASVLTLLDDWNRHAAPSRARLGLLALMASVSGLLALVGICGNVAQFAWVRRREIALRLALGASGAVIRRRLVGSVVAAVVMGTLAGTAVGVAISRVAASQWHGAQWLDTSFAVGLSVSFAIVGLVAAAIPVRRALLSAPMSLLRND